MQAQIVRIPIDPACSQPGRPAQTPDGTQLQRRDLTLRQTQADVPIELHAAIQPDPVHKLLERRPIEVFAALRLRWGRPSFAAPRLRRGRQEALVLRERERSKSNAELMLTIPHASTDHRARAERCAVTR